MKKWIVSILTIVFMLTLVGCNNAKQEKTYSFYGTHEYFSISNGKIVLNDTEEFFEGGNLEIAQPDKFSNIVGFALNFYTIKNGEKHFIRSTSILDQTGNGAVNISCNLGRTSGENINDIIGNISIDELKQNLWFELKTTDINGKENSYQTQLIFRD